jgi:CheY-like chemotaxis protein
MAKSILVVDDNATIRRLLCHLFESGDDYEVCAEASNGHEALAIARSLNPPPDLIILDLSMPVMDGLASARELKMLLPHVPIILFTQYADLGKHLLGSDLPVDRVVSKSHSKELMRHVRSLVPV